MGYFFVAAGVFAILGAVLEWSVFMNDRKARRMVKLLGYQGARVVYGVLGLALVGLGIAFATGFVNSP